MRVLDFGPQRARHWRHLRRELSTWVDDDGMVVIRGRLTPDLDRGTAGDRYQVVLHVEQEAVASERPASGPERGPASEVPAHDSADAEEGRFDGVLEASDGAWRVSAETSRRLTCDASVVVMRHDGDGAVIDVGRKARTIPPSIPRRRSKRSPAGRLTSW